MQYHEIRPDHRLRQYVKCYYTYQSEVQAAFEDTVFPSGCMEIIFNLGAGQWQTAPEEDYITHPPIELWGQIIRPLPVKSIGKNTMLGIRLYPHAAAYLLDDKADLFNNQVADFSSLAGPAARKLHEQLLESPSWNKRIELVEDFLLHRFLLSARRLNKVEVINDVMHDMRRQDGVDNIENIAARYGMTARYLQKLFLQYTGLTPKLYSKINRFQNSLRLVTQKDTSLTSIAYDCGYADQSHFIKEFKSFTGLTPSGYLVEASPVTAAFATN